MPDAYVTAFHLRDMLNTVSVEQLLTWSGEPGLLPRVPSGPNRGKAWEMIEADALTDLAHDPDVNIRFSAQTELQRRAGTEAPPSPERRQKSLF